MSDPFRSPFLPFAYAIIAAIVEDADDGLAVDDLIRLKDAADAEKAAFDGLQARLSVSISQSALNSTTENGGGADGEASSPVADANADALDEEQRATDEEQRAMQVRMLPVLALVSRFWLNVTILTFFFPSSFPPFPFLFIHFLCAPPPSCQDGMQATCVLLCSASTPYSHAHARARAHALLSCPLSPPHLSRSLLMYPLPLYLLETHNPFTNSSAHFHSCSKFSRGPTDPPYFNFQ